MIDVVSESQEKLCRWPVALMVACCFLGVMLICIGPGYKWTMRHLLLREMMGGGSYSLDYDSATTSRLSTLAPRFIQLHREAVEAHRRESQQGTVLISTMNQRVRAWNAILTTIEMTGDDASIDYVRAFTESDLAWQEEAERGREYLIPHQPAGASPQASRSSEAARNAEPKPAKESGDAENAD